MQFRKQGRRVQVLAYRGYDKEKRRSVIRLLGSFDAHNYQLSDGLTDALTDDEKTELQTYIENMRQSNKLLMSRYYIQTIDSSIENVSLSLSNGSYDSMVDSEYAGRVYAAMDGLAATLRKLGHKRPARGRGEAATAAPPTAA